MRRTIQAMALLLALAGAAGAQMPGMGAGPRSIDSNPMALLQRPEVQRHLGISLRQRNALYEMMQGQGQKMQATMMQMQQSMRNLSPQERQARAAEMQQTMQSQASQWQGELTEQIKGILKPDQIIRLHELDLQWRGALCLADPKVGDAVKLGAERRQPIAKLVTDFQQTMQQTVRDAMQEWMQNGGPRSGEQPPIADPTSPARRKIEAARKAGDAAAVKLLTAEEAARWKAAQGEPFIFRKDVAPRS